MNQGHGRGAAGAVTGLLLAGSALCMCGAGAQAQGIAYGVDYNGSLYRVNLANASSTLVGTTTRILECLGMDPMGNLYGVNINGELWRVSTSNGASQYIGTTGLGNVEGMDWDSNTNRMLISDFSSASPGVYEINLTNASVKHVQTATSGGSYIRTLATRAGSSILDIRRETGGNPFQGDLQGSFDLSNGSYSTIGSSTAAICGIDYGNNGVLYGLTTSGDLVTIAPSSGAVQLVGTVNAGSYFLGMATPVGPVPAPSTLALAGLAALCGQRRRRAIHICG